MKGDSIKKGGKRREKNTSISPDALFGVVSSGESSRATIANSNGKCLTSRTTTWKRAGEARTCVCRTLLRSLREQENNTKEPRVSIKDDERDYDGVLSSEDDQDDARRVLTSPSLGFSFNVTMINVCRTNIERRYLIRLRLGIMENKCEKRLKRK